MEKGAQVKRRHGAPDQLRRLPGRLPPRAFFEAPPEHVAPRLLGKLLAHKTAAGLLVGRIVEVEAYLGPHNDPPDPAAHTYRGPTPRNQVIFGPPGHAYLYFIYGRYFCMNISCEPPGRGGGILVRALEPVIGAELMAVNRGLAPSKPNQDQSSKFNCQLTSGPGRLCQALGLTRLRHNGLDLLDPASELQVRDDDYPLTEVSVTARIGIRHAADWPLRFALPDHHCVSGPKNLIANRVSL